MKKNCERQIQNWKFIFRIKPVTRKKQKKHEKFCVKWKGYNGSFNSQTDEKRILGIIRLI